MCRLLLITGIPGTGKTEIGKYLKRQNGFHHLDIEVIINSGKYGTNWLGKLEELIAQAKDKDTDLVLTWGFLPAQDHQRVQYLRTLGFTLVWFDGDKQAARRVFVKRGEPKETAFDQQLNLINSFGVTSYLRPIEYNTFDETGNFKKKEVIAQDLLALV